VDVDLATLTDPANVVGAAAALLSFATIVTIAAPILRRDTLDVRLKAVATRREELRRKSREALAGGRPTTGGADTGLRRRDDSLYKRIVEKLQLAKLLEDPKVVEKLAEAGFRGPRPVTTFYFFRFALPFVFAAVAAPYVFIVLHLNIPAFAKFAIVVAAFAAGFYAPNLYVTNKASKRRGSIIGAFPDALDLMLICVEAGMSIEAALQRVSHEVGGASIELAEELSLLVAELSYLPDRRLAYEGLAKRINSPGVKSVATAMIQAERYGTPLGAALRVMAKENRELRIAAAEKKAAALPAKLTVPMIVFFLPALFAVIMGPALMRAAAVWK
jgi:tight adherence protein C